MEQPNEKPKKSDSSTGDSSKGEPVLSPPEFQIQQPHPQTIVPQEVRDDMAYVLMPAISPLLDKVARYAKQWGMDLSFHASNGIVMSLRSSAYTPGGKARAVSAINHLLERFDLEEKDAIKAGLIAMRDEIIRQA